MHNRSHPTAVDLFSGAGGFSIGAQSVGFNVRLAVERNPAAYYTYKVHIADHDDMTLLSGDLQEMNPTNVLNSVEAIFGGPPCQPFSTAQGDPFDGDPEETLVFKMTDWIAALQPALFAIENVDGLSQDHPDVMNYLLESLRDLGYHANSVTLNAADYGVPQKRSRVFILGVSNDYSPPERWQPPKDRSASPGQTSLGNFSDPTGPYKTAKGAFADLPEPLPPMDPSENPVHSTSVYDDSKVTPHSSTQPLIRDSQGEYHNFWTSSEVNGQEVHMPPNHVEADHQYSTREKYAEWELGYTGNRTTDRRLHPDEPAPTMTVSNGTPPVHFQGKAPSNTEPVDQVRRLTVREVARLQTFPDWGIAGNRLEQFTQVGNAVPPLLAGTVANHLLSSVANELGYSHLYDHLENNNEETPYQTNNATDQKANPSP